MRDTMNQINGLPFEIVVQIIQEFVNRLDKTSGHWESAATEPYLRASSYTELIRLRLISRTWAKAVIPFYFETISVDNSRRAETIIDNWNEDLFRPHSYCPVRRLNIEALWYPKEEVEKTNAEEENKTSNKNGQKKSGLVSVNQLARLIESFGTNLKTMNLFFLEYVAVSTQLIKACETMKELKSLVITSTTNFDISKLGRCDLDSISKLLTAMPQLECLKLDYEISEHMALEPPALSNLRHFCFVYYDDNYEEMSCITESSKNTLKTLEVLTGDEPTEGIEGLFEPIKDTLEGLFIRSYTNPTTEDVTEWTFPNLQVLGSHYPPNHTHLSQIHWLEVPMLKSVRTIVTDLDCSEEYWQDALEMAGVNALKKVPNFKHIIFTQNIQDEPINPELIDAFKSHGVQCHLSHELTTDEIMELDHTLNGPINQGIRN